MPNKMHSMKGAYSNLRMQWLLDDMDGAGASPCAHKTATATDGDTIHLSIPIPPEIGEGEMEMLHLTFGMTVAKAVHRFRPDTGGRMFPLAEVRVEFQEAAFMVQTVRTGHIFHRERHPCCEILLGEGNDAFRHAKQIDLTPILETSRNSEIIGVSVVDSVLEAVLGQAETHQLMAALRIQALPSLWVHKIPAYVTAPLHACLTTSFVGAPRRLYCQAKALEYFGLLSEYLLGKSAPRPDSGRKNRVHNLHEMLTNLDGKLPTLDELARQFGRSVRTLNEEFAAEYGQSITAFITDYRLNAAHLAIIETTTPLKTLASRLGYAHVNHFNAAFRRKFGYPPGSLRKK